MKIDLGLLGLGVAIIFAATRLEKVAGARADKAVSGLLGGVA